METFVILRGGEEIGIFTHPQLRDKVQRGEVLPSDEMQRTGTEERYVVSTVPSLAVFLDGSSENLPTSESYGLASDSSDMSGAAMDTSSFTIDDQEEDTSEDSEVSEKAFDSAVSSAVDAPEGVEEKAQSELARATLFATQNYIRRSIFINQADVVQKTGYILQAVAIVVLGVFAYYATKGAEDTTTPILYAVGWGLAVVLGLVAAALCRDAGIRVIAGVPTAVRSNSTLDLVGLIILTVGVAIFAGLAIIAFTSSDYWPAIFGALALLACVLGAGLALSPSISNVEFRNVDPMEEAAGLITLSAKVLVLLGPFVLACCSSIGLLKGGIALYAIISGNPAVHDMSGWKVPGIILVAGCFYPLVVYVLLLVNNMFERLFK
tara:strand:+ start:794 stop:1930 length:1137 start_codon:yes stop_codon:yes gene_type:complete